MSELPKESHKDQEHLEADPKDLGEFWAGNWTSGIDKPKGTLWDQFYCWIKSLFK